MIFKKRGAEKVNIDKKNHLEILRKNVVKSILDVLILQLLRNNKLCGNEIINELRTRFGSVNYSHVYSTLNTFMKNGLIAYENGNGNGNSNGNGNGNKRVCKLTEHGDLVRKQLAQNYINIDKHIKMCFYD